MDATNDQDRPKPAPVKLGKAWRAVIGVAAGILLLAVGYWWGSPGGEEAAPKASNRNVETWYCSMDPQIRQPEPGLCPICGMDLIPMPEAGGSTGPRELKLSPAAEKLAEVRLASVERKYVTAEIRMSGKVVYDETRLAIITAWVPGRLDRLFADYTGIPVRKGDHLVSLYSPALLEAQEELLQAVKAVDELKQSNLESVRETARRTVTAVKEKLRLWGLTPSQIEDIQNRGAPSEHLTIHAPISGIVVEKMALQGEYVKTGTPIYTLADLSRVWVTLDAYESDLPWIRYGQDVEFFTEAYPGETFSGKVSFINPVLNDRTRTVKVRVNVDNPEGKLKPNLFVRAVVRSRVAKGGRVMDAALAGKWISPMHPEIVKDKPGSCDVCGMPLVRAESLGYVSAEGMPDQAPLVVPATAPLQTGKRAVVYVFKGEGLYEGREVVLGARAGEYYLVKEGLSEGEKVVVNGNFKIDSALQILAKPSMMNPGKPAPPIPGFYDTEQAETFPSPLAFRKELDAVFEAYLLVHHALSRDDLVQAKAGGAALLKALNHADASKLDENAKAAWDHEHSGFVLSVTALQKAEDIIAAREAFAQMSGSMTAVAMRFGTSGLKPVLRFHCPMAFDNVGGYWLQGKEGTENPYFGSAMFKCGVLEGTIVPQGGQPEGKEPGETGNRFLPMAFRKQLDAVFDAYLLIHHALSRDDLQKAKSGGESLSQALEAVEANLLEGKSAQVWEKEAAGFRQGMAALLKSEGIGAARKAFAGISQSMIETARRLGTSGKKPVLRFHCPMAFDGKGGSWLQSAENTENPYFGSAMFRCGSLKETIAPESKKESDHEHDK